jgi:hypothetical protein
LEEEFMRFYTVSVFGLLLMCFTSCGECDHVEPCFSYMPHFATIQLLDGSTAEPLSGDNLTSALKMSEASCNAETGSCTFYVEAGDTIEVVIELEGYQTYSQVYDVQREADQGSGFCKVTGCVLSTELPSTIELQPIE